MFIKKAIVFNGVEIFLKIPISTEINTVGSDDDVNKISENISEPLINPIIDNEVVRYRYGIPNIAVNSIISMIFDYYDYTLLAYNLNPTALGFTQEELSANDPKCLNSFFIFDVFDSSDVLKQNKIYRTYRTRFYPYDDPNLSNLSLNTNQLNSIFLPSNLIDTQLTRLYGKFMFYNAKKNNVSVFYNKNYESLKTADRMFFPIDVDHTNKTWCFANVYGYSSIQYQLYAYETIATNNQFVTKVNNTVTGFNVKQSIPPAGNVLEYTASPPGYSS